MLLNGVLSLFGWHSSPASEAPRTTRTSAWFVPDTSPSEEDDDDPVWSGARVGIAELLWGEGFLSPGGEPEILRLAKPLGLSAASSLLLIGAGSGGPPRCLATELGAWVSAFEENPRLAELASERCARIGLGRRALVQAWDADMPKFRSHYFHHGLALEPLRNGRPEPVLSAIALALKPGGQLVLVETVADLPLDPTDRMIADWARLECRSIDVPSEIAITRTLGRLGFDVRIAEDISERHLHQAIGGWREVLRMMADAKPTLRQASLLVGEAELWMLRFKLMHAGKLRLVRWHAIGRGGVALP